MKRRSPALAPTSAPPARRPAPSPQVEPRNPPAAGQTGALRAGLAARLRRAHVLGHRPEALLGEPGPRVVPDVQADFTTKARLGKNHRIQEIRLSGRPKGRFKGGYQGSHVTAFSIFRDVLESATLGRTVPTAYDNVEQLVEDLSELPGYATQDLPDGRPERPSREVRKSDLQKLMHYYVEARDAAGYSAAFLGEDQAKGKGESHLLRQLRELENQEDPLSQDQVTQARELIQGLFDPDAKANLAPDPTGELAKSITRQHLMTVYQAFPKVYGQLPDQYEDFPELSQPKALAERMSNRDLFGNLGVTIGPDGHGGFETTVAQRPPGPFPDTSTMGSHTVAWSLITEALTTELGRATDAREAKSSLLSLMKEQLDSPLVHQDFRSRLEPRAAARLKAARKLLRRRRAELKKLRSRYVTASDLESAAEAILLHHNASPLSAVDQGLANNANEQIHLAYLRSYENGEITPKPPSKKAAVNHHVYGLVDAKTIENIGSGQALESQAPGHRAGNHVAEVAAILDSLFAHARTAFPTAFEEAMPHHEDNIRYFLRWELGLAIDLDAVVADMTIKTTKRLKRGYGLGNYVRPAKRNRRGSLGGKPKKAKYH